MANYFKHFNKIVYSRDDDSTSLDVLTNLTTKISFMSEYADNTALYYYYNIEDGDTPEILAYKLYGSTDKHWVLLMFNNIQDPQHDWPLEQRTLGNFIEKKYSTSKYSDKANTSVSGLSWSMSNKKEYYVKEDTVVNNTTYNYSDEFIVDYNTYENTAPSQKTISLQSGDTLHVTTSKYAKTYFEYENDLNESKRSIMILKPEFVDIVYKEFKNLVK